MTGRVGRRAVFVYAGDWSEGREVAGGGKGQRFEAFQVGVGQIERWKL